MEETTRIAINAHVNGQFAMALLRRSAQSSITDRITATNSARRRTTELQTGLKPDGMRPLGEVPTPTALPPTKTVWSWVSEGKKFVSVGPPRKYPVPTPAPT